MTSTYAQCILVRVDYASADELCPENHCTKHRAYDNIRVMKYKLHTLVGAAEILLLMNGKFTIAIVSIMFLNRRLVITRLVSSSHCIVCSSVDGL
jgi:hypothetical protein